MIDTVCGSSQTGVGIRVATNCSARPVTTTSSSWAGSLVGVGRRSTVVAGLGGGAVDFVCRGRISTVCALITRNVSCVPSSNLSKASASVSSPWTAGAFRPWVTRDRKMT